MADNGETSLKPCIFKRAKRGGGNVARRNQKQSSSGSSDSGSDNEIYKRAKKNRSGLMQSTSAFKGDSNKKRKWQKQVSFVLGQF